MVEESQESDASVSLVARRHGVNPNQLFTWRRLAAHGALVRQVSAAVAATEPRAAVEVTITPQYRNMRYWLEKDMRPVDLALTACRDIGIEPRTPPVRGGTDGSRLTEMGVPCPNLFTGMQQVHGPLEYVSTADMAAAVRLALRLVELWGRETP